MVTSEIKAQKFVKKLEEAVRQANQEAIDPMVPALSINAVLPVAVMVAKMRGRYIAKMLEVCGITGGQFPEEEKINKLREYRVAYEESLTAFQAMEHAIERGFLEIINEKVEGSGE